MLPRSYRNDFPILRRRIHGKPLVYFDNAATTQKPRSVIDAISHYYERTNANIHRGIHTLAEEATEAYEGARKKVADFIGAKDPAEIIFTRNATEAINLVAHGYHSLIPAGGRQARLSAFGGNRRIVSKNEPGVVLLTEMEHHSNLVPWQMLVNESRIKNHESRIQLKFIPVKKNGTLDYSKLNRLITKQTAIVSVTHASNVLGTINDIPRIVKAAHRKGVPVLADAAQSVGHMPVNVQKLGCDFLVFSGHKMLGPTGIGVLWGRRELLEAMPPFLGGGDMIRQVRYDGFEPNEIPWKFEAGTPHIAGAIGLGAAVDYLQKIGMKNIREHEIALTKYALQKMRKIFGLTIYGPQNVKGPTSDFGGRTSVSGRTGVIAFNLDGVHPVRGLARAKRAQRALWGRAASNGVHAHDLATVLDREGIAIRSGHHCAEPLVRKFGQTAMARVSFYLYNTKEEIDRFIEALKKARKVFKCECITN